MMTPEWMWIRVWGVHRVLGKEAAHAHICSHHHRALWPLRMWLCTFPKRNGGSLVRPRNSCTGMSCWRPLHWLCLWVRPSPLCQHPGQVSAFPLFSKSKSVLFTARQWAALYYFFLSSVFWVPSLSECVFHLLSQVAPMPAAEVFSAKIFCIISLGVSLVISIHFSFSLPSWLCRPLYLCAASASFLLTFLWASLFQELLGPSMVTIYGVHIAMRFKDYFYHSFFLEFFWDWLFPHGKLSCSFLRMWIF